MNVTVVEWDSKDTGQKQYTWSKKVITSLSDTRGNAESALGDLSVMTKAYIKVRVKSHMTKRASALQLQIVKSVGTTFEDALQTSYFLADSGLKPTISKVFEQVLGAVIRSVRVLTVCKDERRALVQTQSAPYIIVQPVLLNTEFIVSILKIVCKMVDGAVNKYRLRCTQEASTATARPYTLIVSRHPL